MSNLICIQPFWITEYVNVLKSQCRESGFQNHQSIIAFLQNDQTFDNGIIFGTWKLKAWISFQPKEIPSIFHSFFNCNNCRHYLSKESWINCYTVCKISQEPGIAIYEQFATTCQTRIPPSCTVCITFYPRIIRKLPSKKPVW